MSAKISLSGSKEKDLRCRSSGPPLPSYSPPAENTWMYVSPLALWLESFTALGMFQLLGPQPPCSICPTAGKQTQKHMWFCCAVKDAIQGDAQQLVSWDWSVQHLSWGVLQAVRQPRTVWNILYLQNLTSDKGEKKSEEGGTWKKSEGETNTDWTKKLSLKGSNLCLVAMETTDVRWIYGLVQSVQKKLAQMMFVTWVLHRLCCSFHV